MEKLDLVDKKLLVELDKNCRTPNTVLAKKLKISRETVTYRIKRLEEKHILQGFITSINPNKLGYFMFKVYLKLEHIPKRRETFFKALQSNKNIYWLGIASGTFDCVFAIVSKSIVDYYKTVNILLAEYKDIIITKMLGTMVDTHQFNKKMLVPTQPQSVVFGGDVVYNTYDQLDVKIIDLLANNARMPLLELARRTNSTLEIVRGRIKKLEHEKVILSYRTSINFAMLGFDFYKMFVYLRITEKQDEAALAEWCLQHPKAVYYIRSLAPWDIEPEFVVESYAEFNAIVEDMRQQFPHIIRNFEHITYKEEFWMPGYGELLV